VRGTVLLLAVMAFVVAPASALAARGPQVPPFTLHLIQAKAGDATYLPSRLPARYRYERWTFAGGKLTVFYKNAASARRFSFEVTKLPATRACDLDGAFEMTLQLYGNKVYYRGERRSWIAWRCVTSPKTGQRYTLGVRSNGPLPDLALATVDSFGKRFAA
jgi:hypothetical protein